jgi:class 3 adenylate cyclase
VFISPEWTLSFDKRRRAFSSKEIASCWFALGGIKTAMGPPGSQIITAIGDAVNACARLENLTKDYDCAVIVSRRAAEVAGLDAKSRKLHRASVQGRMQTVEFYALKTLADLRV